MVQFILFAPLLGALIAGFGWRMIGERAAQLLTTGILFACAAFSWIVFLSFDGVTQQIPVLDWVVSGDLQTNWAIRLDRLTAIMLIVVTTVSALVHMYSMGYMAHDENWEHGEHYKARFFAYLSFFTFAMLMLVTADNLLQMFFGWEGVGVASYLLIGFYYRKPSANAAAMKAFIVNRVGDFGFLLGMFGLFWMTGSIQFDEVFAQIPELAQTQMHFLWADWSATNLLAFLLFIGAMGKSAQLFLHTWLPDAMEGPTPVSALIHAATMVTAGVFLVCRMSPLFEFAPEAKMFVTIIGATTAFFAATVGLVQNDIKRVIAYSTCSQLGYMFVAAGVGVYSVAMFHLFTHAFFKAMLFLGAGSVIHAMHHEQDMRNYGGLRKKIPLTFMAMLIGTLAITGVGIPLTYIGFAGFLSKDAVIESAWAANNYAFWMLVVAAAMTSFYSWRLMFMTFWGKPRGDQHAHEHAHESPPVMTIPLGVLAAGAIFAGMIWYQPFFGSHDRVLEFFGIGHGEAAVSAEAGEGEATAAAGHGTTDAASEEAAEGEDGSAEAGIVDGVVMVDPSQTPEALGGAIYMAPYNEVMDKAHYAPKWVKLSPFFAMLGGLALAWLMYIRYPTAPARLAAQQPVLYRFLLNKWYFDEIYNFLIVRPTLWLGRKLWLIGDGKIIDGTINGIAMGLIPRLTRFAGRLQSGYLFHYAFAMVLGVVGLLIWVMTRGTH
ncbi:NADH-quinone oxidoreductase subunit L [Paracoccus fistulariae]|uniref:NADH-quinone oxidoreductase subunit L n=1 Tax=Paracoccus fistulariae TaxID=658446 RepID=A0ABY7SK51_9RHOB|nr:NADH-quinone oxidoreductase subunit L [Paracoccus fistulariae]MDB6181344.1 NADH-quinone oxidoreductase subunit L [Paracoccus fistulariae]WCR07393.1 NADH-quinone oxidoreductase subunit L [Paracoccus fistulariae]